QLSVKIQAKQVITECDFWRHLQLLRKAIRRGEVIPLDSIAEQRPQRANSVRCYAAKSLERIAGVLALFRIFGTNLQCCQIELIEIVLWFFLYRSCELFFLFGKIAFCARQPTSNDMKSCAVTISRRDSIQRFAGEIELTKAERCGGKVELTLRVFWQQSRYA